MSSSSLANPSARDLLRHTLATLAYRGEKAIRGMTPETATFRAGEKSRTPAEILAHIGDLLDWAASIIEGEQKWQDSAPVAWEAEVERFFKGLAKLDSILESRDHIEVSYEKLFQGPIADALAHVGQISMLRRLGGAPVRGENYYRAEIVAGRVGADQAAPRREFE